MGKRDWGILLLAIALTVLGVVRVFVDSAVQTGAWGLSFRQEGTAPIGNAGADQLRQFDAVGNLPPTITAVVIHSDFRVRAVIVVVRCYVVTCELADNIPVTNTMQIWLRS